MDDMLSLSLSRSDVDEKDDAVAESSSAIHVASAASLKMWKPLVRGESLGKQNGKCGMHEFVWRGRASNRHLLVHSPYWIQSAKGRRFMTRRRLAKLH